jgi:glycosyltransferase involved in cell wall biosynthesis
MKQYDKIFLTNVLVFYKVKLYNAIAEKGESILVIHTEDKFVGQNVRSNDALAEKVHFDTISFAKISVFEQCKKMREILKEQKSYKELIGLSYIDLLSWYTAFFLSPKNKNSVVVESSYHESKITGWKRILKKIFHNRISKAYCSGRANAKLMQMLDYKGKIVITKGVGIFNYIQQPQYEARKEVKNFIYVGRLVNVKNIDFIIRVFNTLPQYNLYIIGGGPCEKKLKGIAKENIIFLGMINNKELSQYYQKNDVFILPSKSEPWGLVVEEALNNGLPILLSNKIGCWEELLKEGENGFLFDYDKEDSLKEAIDKITNIDTYNKLRFNISKLDYEKIEDYQVSCYLN